MLPPPSQDTRYAELLRRVQNLETALRAAFTTISGGAGIQIVDGGRLALVAADGTIIFYIGPVSPNQSDGSPQPGWTVCRADGTVVLQLRDQFPDPVAGLQQALNWFARDGGIVLADDTNSGQGMARPYLAGVLYPSRYADLSQPTTAATDTWETVLRGELPKQQPRLEVAVRATMDTSGATGELRVLVNGNQLGSAQPLSFLIGSYLFGPGVVAGSHMQTLVVEVQGCRRTGTGGVRAHGIYMQGRQS